MRPSRRSIAAAAALAAALFAAMLAPSLAFATCGAEGCPCVRRGLADNAGRFSFDARFLDVTQDELRSGSSVTSLDEVISSTTLHHHIPLYTRTRSWSFEGRMRVNDRLRLSANLPYVDREHRRFDRHTPFYTPALVQSWRFRGVGDAVVQAQVDAWERAGGPRIAVQAGVKLPTGKRHVAKSAGLFATEPQPTLRPGTGSTDLLAGVTITHPMPWQPVLPLSMNVLRRWNGRGTDDYRGGDELQASLSSGWAVRPWMTLTALANFSSHAGDSWTEPTADDPYREPSHAGGRALFLTPGASVSLGSGITLYGVWQNRVWGESDQPMVVARNYFLFGSSISLGM
ncbi:MAG: transporter [Candidatus Eisenbacteria bacterium]